MLQHRCSDVTGYVLGYIQCADTLLDCGQKEQKGIADMKQIFRYTYNKVVRIIYKTSVLPVGHRSVSDKQISLISLIRQNWDNISEILGGAALVVAIYFLLTIGLALG